MQHDLTTRENRILELEPYLDLAKKLQEMKLEQEAISPWLDIVKETAQMQKIDIKSAATYVAQELSLNKQFGGIQKQIEKANQELTLINMSAIKKQQAITVLGDLLDKGVTESQILQLVQQPSNDNGSHNSNINNGYSMSDFIKLNLLKNRISTTTNMLNMMAR